MTDEFDSYKDIKEENGMNQTENKVYDAMKKLGLDPKPQYEIGNHMHVDFAFPEKKVVIEIGKKGDKYHSTPEQINRDKRRWFALTQHYGWKIKTYGVDFAYNHPGLCAEKIKDLLNETHEQPKPEKIPIKSEKSIYYAPINPNRIPIGAILILGLLAFIFIHFLLIGFNSIDNNISINSQQQTPDITTQQNIAPAVTEPFFDFQKESKSNSQIKQEIANKIIEYESSTSGVAKIFVFSLAQTWGVSKPIKNPSGMPCSYTMYIPGYQNKYIVTLIFQTDCLGGRNKNGYSVDITYN